MQAGAVVACASKTHPVARVHCVAVSRLMTAAGPAAGGFALLHPLPEAMWGPDAVFKLSLRRVTVPTEAEAAAALEKEASKLPARLAMVTKALAGGVLELDAGRKVPECSLEVRRRLAGPVLTHAFSVTAARTCTRILDVSFSRALCAMRQRTRGEARGLSTTGTAGREPTGQACAQSLSLIHI